MSGLPERQRDALLGAFGMGRAAVPDVFLIGLGTLELMSQAATEQPLLVVVDDVQWLDDSTCEVLAFVARRLETEQVALVAAIRDGYESFLLDSGLEQLPLEALDEREAAELLDRRIRVCVPVSTRPGSGPRLRQSSGVGGASDHLWCAPT